ncbi:MAG: diphthine synthase [Nitrososphaerota archaeon]|nr:diphthine synthase [Candidatus Bathyarchaeota archaeon]MDW8048502.1 diphthine synthase [Nitrososphaerota archaeon]
MGELIFIGLGLSDELDLSLRAVEELRKTDHVFAEFYTSVMPSISLKNLERIIGKRVTVVSRKTLEDENGECILSKAGRANVALLVPGDPLIATTHVALRIEAEKRGIKTRVIHGVSIISAAIGLSGLQNYRFGRTVTIPFSEQGIISETPYEVISENKARNLHTLCFLDIDVEKQRYLSIDEAFKMLLTVEERKRKGIINMDAIAVVIARAGSKDALMKAGRISELLTMNFGPPPYTLIFIADKLHFMEAEALMRFADAPESIKERIG